MSKQRRHPRPATARTSARSRPDVRYVTSEATDVLDAGQLKMMREMCRAFDAVTEPLDVERTASRMHGRMWELRATATSRCQPDWSFGLGAPVARQIARIGGPGAKGLLVTFGFQAPTRLRELCVGLAGDLPVPTPDWAKQVPSARLTRAAATVEVDAPQLVLLEFRRGDRQPFTLGVMISDRDSGIATHYALLRPFDAFAETGDPNGAFGQSGLAFEALDRREACRRVRRAVQRADRVDERRFDLASAKELRALTLSRVEQYERSAVDEP